MKAKPSNSSKRIKAVREQFITILEGVLFNEGNLEATKKDIKNLLEHKITEKEFKKSLLVRRGEMMEELLLMIPYFLNLTKANIGAEIPISKQCSEGEKERLKLMIKEREALLTQVAKRVQKISERMGETSNDSEKLDSQKENSHQCTQIFTLDGSNIARHNRGSEIASIKDVIGTKNRLVNLGVPKKNIFIIFGSALYHYISKDDMPLYRDLLKDRNCVQAPAGADDDWFILQHALKNNSYIITNDHYKEYRERSEEYEEFIESHSIRYNIIGEEIYFQEGFMERNHSVSLPS